MTVVDDAATVEPSRYPLIVFVHVPKTAGSTVQTVLHKCTPRGHGNVQVVLHDRASFLELARNADWIGGHVSREALANGLVWLNRPVEYFASVREPVAQLVSHLNFSFERYGRDDYYDLHDRGQQQLDAEVMATDFSNPAAVMALLFRHGDLFLDMQSKLVLGADFAQISDDEIRRRLASYTYVATEHDLPALYRAFGFARLPEDVAELRENVAKSHFDARIFDSPQLRAFLVRHHRHDLRLYDAVRRASWSAEGRSPFRPVFLRVHLFTPENFEERAYLESNLDVAAAVARGLLASGRAHFETHGYAEGRMMRRWFWPPATIRKPQLTEEDFSASTAVGQLRALREEIERVCQNVERVGGASDTTSVAIGVITAEEGLSDARYT